MQTFKVGTILVTNGRSFRGRMVALGAALRVDHVSEAVSFCLFEDLQNLLGDMRPFDIAPDGQANYARLSGVVATRMGIGAVKQSANDNDAAPQREAA